MSKLLEVIRRTTLACVQAPGTIDAIVIGAGATGGLAAQRWTEAGLRVLVLDAGVPRSPVHVLGKRIVGRATRRVLGTNIIQWRARRRQPIQAQCYAWANLPEAFVDDLDCPYTMPNEHPFVWLRCRQIGGRLAVPGHGRQYYRLSHADLHPSDGLSTPWPLEPGELDPWYAQVEQQLGMAGRYEANPFVPDSVLSRESRPSHQETDLIDAVVRRWPHAKPMLGRCAVPPRSVEVAARTGRLLVRTGAIAKAIDVDAAGHVRGVSWIDLQSRSELHLHAPLVFLGASALESTRLLMLSRSRQHPEGLGAASGVLGRYLMDHLRVTVSGYGPPLPAASASPERGRCVYLPRFDARAAPTASGRGFGVQVYLTPWKQDRSDFSASAYGEMLPRPENRVSLDESRRDAWGIPTLHIDCAHSAEDLRRAREQRDALRELADALGMTITSLDAGPAAPGSANHECGTARMGRDAGSSVFDPYNQCWDARGLYLADGACLPSQGMQNPTLTLLALTARACTNALSAARG